MEVIVVDNSSTDNTEAVIESWKVVPFQLRFYRKENRGPAASRNYGAARARGAVLAFTDSDCLPVPGWLREAARLLEQGFGIVCGPIVPVFTPDLGFFHVQISNSMKDSGLYPTANLFIRREAFQAVGGFNECFGLYPWGGLVAGEDTDLAWRLKRAGERAVFSEHVAVAHLATPVSPKSWLLYPIRLQILPRLLRSIPELRRTDLYRGYFASKEIAYFHIAWTGIALAFLTRWWLAGAAVLPWLWRNRTAYVQRLRRGHPLKALAALALITERYILATLVLIFASIRYRRLVL